MFGLIDALNGSPSKIKGVAWALWHVGDESSNYEICHMHSGVLPECIGAVREALSDEWAPDDVPMTNERLVIRLFVDLAPRGTHDGKDGQRFH